MGDRGPLVQQAEVLVCHALSNTDWGCKLALRPKVSPEITLKASCVHWCVFQDIEAAIAKPLDTCQLDCLCLALLESATRPRRLVSIEGLHFSNVWSCASSWYQVKKRRSHAPLLPDSARLARMVMPCISSLFHSDSACDEVEAQNSLQLQCV